MAYTDIDDPSKYFQTKIYTGTNNELVLTFDGNSDMQPDMIWTKNRGRVANHVLSDTVRGIGKGLYPDLTSAEGDTNYISAIGSDGYTIVATDSVEINRDDDTFVSWNWKKSATAGLDIVGFTGNETNRTVSHSLSAVPHYMVVRTRNGAAGRNYSVYHHKNTAAPATDHIFWDSTQATEDDATIWNDTAPTSSVFSIGTNLGVNENTKNIIAFLWTEKQGFSKFGSYTGNGNANGPFIYLGFKPAYIVIKQSDGANGWNIYDNKRNTINVMDKFLLINDDQAEASYSVIDFLSNGIKLRNTASSFNTSGKSYIYMAFAENPLVTSTGVPTTAR
mgnify:FL=1